MKKVLKKVLKKYSKKYINTNWCVSKNDFDTCQKTHPNLLFLPSKNEPLE